MITVLNSRDSSDVIKVVKIRSKQWHKHTSYICNLQPMV